MTKRIIIIITIIQISCVFSFEFINPFWQKGIRHTSIAGKNPFLFTEPQFIANFSIPVDYADGIYFGAYYQFDTEVRLSKLFNFYSTLKLGVNAPTLNSTSVSWIIYPIPYLRVIVNYKFRNFSQYQIFEHNMSFAVEGIFDFKKMPRWLDIEHLFGFNFRFVDLDIRDNKTKYRNDWIMEIFMLFQVKFMFHPAFVYSFGFAFGNYDEYVVHTANYWQFEIYNYFHIIKGFSLFCNAGFSLSGSFPFAGIINRSWGELGVRYGFKEF